MQDLIDQVRQLTNTENNQFFTDSEIATYLQNSIGELDDLLCVKQEDYRLTNTTFTITSGNTFSLPSDFYQLRGVDYYTSSNVPNPWQTLRPFDLQQRNQYSSALLRTIYGSLNIYYMLQGPNVAIIPQDGANGTYQLWYVPVVPDYTSNLDGYIDTYFCNQAWTEYATQDTAVKMLNKQNLDPSAYIDRVEKLKQRILSMAGHRDSAFPKRRINTRYNDFYIDDYASSPFWF
jgi:hypothetical protein